MKRSPKKLSLCRESIHRLESGDLAAANGAAPTHTCNTACSCQIGCATYTHFGTCTC